MKARSMRVCVLLLCMSTGLCASCSQRSGATDESWNRRTAATYLDQHEEKWMKWPTAARDQGTFCVSCHTVMPYALARQAIYPDSNTGVLSADERRLIDDVTKRVRLWKEIKPYYGSQAAQSLGTEAVLNALILANHDAPTGKLSEDARLAFSEMWSLQQTSGPQSGAWQWINFNNEPWEAPDSPFYGATLAAIAVGVAPENYRSAPEIQKNLKMLSEYLDRNYQAETLLNRASLLWASAKLSGILDSDQQQAIIAELVSKQRTDGGWSTSSLIGAWQRRDRTALVAKSDGYATGFIIYVLRQAGVSRGESHVSRGLSWLIRNQGRWDGGWEGYSPNEWHFDLFPVGKQFMDDAATAYAVLALSQSDVENAAREKGQPGPLTPQPIYEKAQ